MKLKYLIFTILTITLNLQTKSQEKTNTIIEHSIDNSSYKINQVFDENKNLLYYYSDFTSEIKVRIYWDIFGNFLKFSLPKGESLTKLGDKSFRHYDYVRLQQILLNKSSQLNYISLDNFNNQEAEDQYNIDASTGATPINTNYLVIKGAAKKCYILWHLANSKFTKIIYNLTDKYLIQNASSKDLSYLASDELIEEYLTEKVSSNKLLIVRTLIENEEQIEIADMKKLIKLKDTYLMNIIFSKSLSKFNIRINDKREGMLESNSFFTIFACDYFLKYLDSYEYPISLEEYLENMIFIRNN